jgi:Uncharacterized protein conserved in bacteria
LHACRSTLEDPRKEWQDALAKNGWSDFFRIGDEFSAFLNNEITRIGGVLRDLGLVQ